MSGQQRPDFVILGVPHPDGVTVFASTDLRQAELEYEAEYVEQWGLRAPIRAYHTYTLTAQMGTIHMVKAPDYGSALRTLFEQWTPPTSGGRQGIAAPVRPLGSADLLAIESGDHR